MHNPPPSTENSPTTSPHPTTTPTTPPYFSETKQKTLRSDKCKLLILLVLGPCLTNGDDTIFPLHFNLECIPRLPFSSVVNRPVRHNSFPLWRQSLRGLHCGLVMIFNYTDAFTQGVKRRWGSLKDQRFGPKVDLCVLADAFSRDAQLKSAPGYKKAISRPKAVSISNRGSAKTAIWLEPWALR